MSNFSSHFSLLFAALFLISSCSSDDSSPEEISVCGCMEESSPNFNAQATCDDGSCLQLDDEVKTLNILFTSTGCGACGIWGIDCHKNYSSAMLKNAVPFELHFKYGDPMINKTNDSFISLVRPQFSPFFSVGLDRSIQQGMDRPHSCELSGEYAEKLIEEFAAVTPTSKIAVSHLATDDSITVHYAIELDDAAEDIYYALYISEDSLVHTQNAGWKNDLEGYVHHNVVRKSITPVLGRKMKTSSKVGKVTIHNQEIWNPEHLKAVLVLWNRSDAANPTVYNAEQSTE